MLLRNYIILSLLILLSCSHKNEDGGIVNPTPPGITRTYLALGDSYTIGQSVDPSLRYPVQAIKMLQQDGLSVADPYIIAVTGWTTNDLLNAFSNDPDKTYDWVTLLIGVNNQYQHRSQQEYRDQFTQLLIRSIKYAGNRANRVIVLSIPDYSVTPFVQPSNKEYVSRQIDTFNIINKEIALNYNTRYIDVTTASREAASDRALIASDSLHFSGIEYSIWATMLKEQMKLGIQ